MGNLGLVIPHQGRIGAKGFDENAGRQQVALGVENIAPAGLDQELALGVSQRYGAQLVMAQNLQVNETIAQHGKAHADEQGQHCQSLILQLFRHRSPLDPTGFLILPTL